MGIQQKTRWLVLLGTIIALALAACGASPTPDVDQATATTESGVVEPTASSLPTDTPVPVDTATEEPPPSPTPTPTPTPAAAVPMTPTDPPSLCQGLSGELEMQVLVGPAEAVGMEPLAVGKAPFSVISSEPPYLVQGGGPIAYDAVQEHDWGTYSVMLDMDTNVSGECTGAGGNETLALLLEATGEQVVVVDAVGFQGEYPWSGAHAFDLEFPLVDGASVEGEGYAFVLHLPGQ